MGRIVFFVSGIVILMALQWISIRSAGSITLLFIVSQILHEEHKYNENTIDSENDTVITGKTYLRTKELNNVKFNIFQ